MGKDCCPSKHHFAKVITLVEGRPDKITWKCDHCGKHVMSGVFRSAYARIHLAAEKSNGLCANLCDSKDDHAHGRQMQFRKLIADLTQKKKDRARKRKQQEARLEQREREIIIISSAKKKKKTTTQPKLKDYMKANDAAAADYAVAQWAIAHDIAPNAMQGPYWRNMNKKLAKVSPTYSPMYPHKVNKDMLPKLKKMATRELEEHLRHRSTVGRTLTGDGATKKVPLINFLLHVPGKGVNLVDIIDCSEHMSEGGTKDSMYVQDEILIVILMNTIIQQHKSFTGTWGTT